MMNMNGQTMTQKHKHADVLIAIAEGREVEYFNELIQSWVSMESDNITTPITFSNYKWRIKPEPSPDVEVYLVWDDVRKGVALRLTENFLEDWKHAIKLTFDAETNEYKSTEVIK